MAGGVLDVKPTIHTQIVNVLDIPVMVPLGGAKDAMNFISIQPAQTITKTDTD
jgi:hypothetical protein